MPPRVPRSPRGIHEAIDLFRVASNRWAGPVSLALSFTPAASAVIGAVIPATTVRSIAATSALAVHFDFLIPCLLSISFGCPAI